MLFAVVSLIGVGLALSLGPVVYNTVERIQMVLVAVVLLFLLVIFFLVVEPGHIIDMIKGIASFGRIPADMEMPLLLGAIAFAGAGGTMNLAQSHFVRDKGYAMGSYVGRLTSPLTGKEEPVADIGYHFEGSHTGSDQTSGRRPTGSTSSHSICSRHFPSCCSR